jgi:hypothetical protein
MAVYDADMPQLPRSDHAILDLRKLEDYCLDPNHPRGRHKARMFRELLGVTRADAGWLKDILLSGAREGEGIELASNIFGARWRIDMAVSRHGNSVVLRTIWIVRAGETIPRFVTCWVL